ncbi:galactokinase [Bacillus sp. T3]|uniref:galactokinase n=1 Tax=Bacillus sp. T3 TaxID=467262 RepID=UPI002980B319|nr:galactokinase [Bacillus sp. T3]
MNFRALASDFQTSFSQEADHYFFSPGRINLLGEHTEYNGGHILPCAITLGTYGAVSKRTDRLVRLYSKNFSEQGMIQFTLDDLDFLPSHGWVNYPKRILSILQQEGHKINEGFDLLVSGNIPQRAGVSSSASLLMLVGEIANKLSQLHIPRLELINAGRAAEQEINGAINGIMDPFIVAKGKMNHAILLDCHTLAFDYIPLKLEHYKIILMNTNKPSEQAASIYNQRRDECEHALRHLQGAINILSLSDLNLEQFENSKHLIPTDILKKRVQHVVSENARTLLAIKEIKRGNLPAFGSLLNQSHISLRNHYEVTGVELDTLVEASWRQPGVLGAKMTGIGMGGSAIALVETSEVDQFMEHVNDAYRMRLGYDVDFYVTSIGDGVREVNLET